MKVRLVTVVWGREFVDIFLRVGLRSLLAGGNVLDLARAHRVAYTIYTTPEDRQSFESEPAFVRLAKALDVQFSLFKISEIDSADSGSHGIFWYRAIEMAQRRGEVLFFIMPDVIYARGTLLAWARRFEEGARAVFTIGPRVALETMLPELEARFPARHAALDFSREQLHELLFRHFHPLHTIMRRDSPRRFSHPEYDIRVVPGQGVIVREMVSHPFCLDPGYFSKLRYFAPEDHLESLAFEPCSTVSVEPLLKFAEQWYRPWPLDGNRLSNLGGWWDWHGARSCERESEFPFEVYYRSNGNRTPCTSRSRAIAAGSFYRAQVLAAARIFKLFTSLREQRFHQAAALLAAANYAGRLRRRLALRRGAILLVPTDAAFAADQERVSQLLLPGRERELLDLIADHIVLDRNELRASRRWRKLVSQSPTLPSDSMPLLTARGLRAEALFSRMTYSGEPFAVGPFLLYPVDRILWRNDGGKPESAPRRQQPLLRRGIKGLAHAFHRIVPIIKGVLLARRSARFSIRALRKIRRVSIRALRRGARRFGISGLIARVRRRSTPALRLARTAHAIARRDGISVAVRTAMRWVRRAADQTIRPPIAVPDADIEVLNEVRSVRALQAVEEALAEFLQKLDCGDLRSAPLAFVQDKLNALAKAGGAPLPAMLTSHLLALTDKNPHWAEAWLELGFLRQDEGKIEAALSCFERAMRAKSSDGTDDSRILAAATRSRLLTVANRHVEALDNLAFCARHNPHHPMIAVEYADALRRIGRLDQAMAYYAQGMPYRPPRWKLPPFPRNAAAMTFARLVPNSATSGVPTESGSASRAESSSNGATLEAVN